MALSSIVIILAMVAQRIDGSLNWMITVSDYEESDNNSIITDETVVLERNNTSETDGSFTLDHSNITIHIPVIVPISSCHPGFQFNPKSQKCECFDNDIVLCSGSRSMIKRGYWFGDVDGKSTVSPCSLSYCDFTSCDTAIDVCGLSPRRTNQCRSHRYGIACGNCDKNFTLPFYSLECTNKDNCTVLHPRVAGEKAR